MADPVSRRSLLQGILTASALASPLAKTAALAQAAAPGKPQVQALNPMYPEGYLKVLGFFDERDRDWYEGTHVPDFLSFARPFMARYARNWIEGVEQGDAPSFRVITEIQYRDEGAKAEVRRLMASPAGQPLLQHTIAHRAARSHATGATAGPEPLRLFSVEPKVVGHAPSPSTALVRRRVVLLRRPPEVEQAEFSREAAAFAQRLLAADRGRAISLDLFGASAQAGPADAVVYCAQPDAALPPPGEFLQVSSVLRVATLTGSK